MKRSDRLIGIVLGLIVGVVAVVLFVFLGGAGSIDAPSLDERGTIDRPATTGNGADASATGGPGQPDQSGGSDSGRSGGGS